MVTDGWVTSIQRLGEVADFEFGSATAADKGFTITDETMQFGGDGGFSSFAGFSNEAGLGSNPCQNTFTARDRTSLSNAICAHVFERVAHEHDHVPGFPSKAPSGSLPRACDRLIADGPLLDPDFFDALSRALVEPDEKDFQECAYRLERSGHSIIGICELFVLPLARNLGQAWANDVQDFVSVAVASTRLQCFVNHLAAVYAAPVPDEGERTILLARMPLNFHVLGMTVLNACFAEAGWNVLGGSDMEAGAPVLTLLKAEHVDVLGLSMGTQTTDTDFELFCGRAAACSKNPNLRIAAGGIKVIKDPAHFMSLGADFVANSPGDALRKSAAA
ncbi:methylmalonyl-CoA mutase cobalamin-binding subunit [Roseibium hamelinense]|uniref:Methylmalonyl-CoA mutase cobalamin-binding subunit n=1 Tax=Roseibium hamelinense TaxID=150831 RepID=A0A562SXE1_9HYPH|nr:cobalamin-dependent protein [Roseibium hamelinense]MTI44830.1 hypothetical protein [Roseibium hamelinense]TWI85977.1 methylmalonyl-CoA mutase cobalamin-binding subunit [Roseibium hamelinense]